MSASAAEALEQIPVLGSLVQVVTLRNYLYDDGHSFADVSVPQVLEGGQAGSAINAAVQADIDRLLKQFQQDAEVLSQGGYQSLDVSYEVASDTDRWFTLRVSALQTQASGYQILRYYHIDKTTGEMVALSDLFPTGSDYVAVLSDEVLRQMEEEDRSYFPNEFRSIDPDQDFYWTSDGGLVLVFDEASVAAAAEGVLEFPISASTLEALQAELP